MSLISENEVRVRRCYSKVHAQPCYHGYCVYCGKTLTAFDFDEESCRKIGAGKPHHDCPLAPQEKEEA